MRIQMLNIQMFINNAVSSSVCFTVHPDKPVRSNANSNYLVNNQPCCIYSANVIPSCISNTARYSLIQLGEMGQRGLNETASNRQ